MIATGLGWRQPQGAGTLWHAPHQVEGSSHRDRSRRNQRLRPHRPQLLPRRPRVRCRPRDRRGQRPHRQQDASRTCSSTTRCSACSPTTSSFNDDSITVGGKTIKVFDERDPADHPLGRAGRRHRHRVDRLLHRRHQGARAHRRRRQEGHHLGPGLQRRRHHRHGRQRRGLRPGHPARHLERVVHHELPRPAGQGFNDEFGIERA